MAPVKKDRRQSGRAPTSIKPPLDLSFVGRRIKRHLDDLERTNYTEPTSGGSSSEARNEDPNRGSTSSGIRDEKTELQGQKKKKSTPAVRQLLMYRKPLALLIEESGVANLPLHFPSYNSIAMTPTRFPPLRLCSVCGFKTRYKCQKCGLLYCDMGCKAVHDETRCERRG